MNGNGVPLVGLAHGSRDPRAAEAIGELMQAVAGLRPGLRTSSAFLDLSAPDLTTALASIDADRAVVLPLLFAQAFHARVDVPEAVVAAAASRGMSLLTGDILGLGPAVLAALQDSADRVGVGADQDILLLAVGTSDAVANQGIHDLADRWSTIRPGGVRAVFATAAPTAADALALEWSTPPAVVSLFLAPGLLLDQVIRRAAARDVVVTPPLGTAMAQLVLDRYDAVMAKVAAASTG
jgi:sirohydrochlorin ferrochelatase